MFRTASIVAGSFGLLFVLLSGFRLDISMFLGFVCFGGAGWAYWQMKQTRKKSVQDALPSVAPSKPKSPTT
jgi:hypothetical protein